MSFEELENNNNNNISNMSVKKGKSSMNSATKSGDKNMAKCNDKLKVNGVKTEQAKFGVETPRVRNGVEGKRRLISSSDSGKGTGNEQNISDNKSEQSQQTNSEGQTNGDNIESGRSRSNSSDGIRVEDKLLAADAKYNKEEINALLEPVAEKQLPAQASESENHSRTVSWVNNHGNNEVPEEHDGTDESAQRQFSNHLDVKKYYMKLKGPEFMKKVIEKMNSRDRYMRRVNYDPDQPAAGTKEDMEVKFELKKMSVKKLIGLGGENSEMIRAVNQVDFYVSKDEDDCEDEVVTIRGHYDNVGPAAADIQDMLASVGIYIDVKPINTAVNPSEFCLQNVHDNYLRIRLNNLESVNVTGAFASPMGISLTMQNMSDYRYSRLLALDATINEVYGTPTGYMMHELGHPPEPVPLPINDYSIVVAPDEEGKYYRAIVEGTDIVSGNCAIWFLDWGGKTIVHADRLLKMHNSFTELPYMCLIGNLAGCRPVIDRNPDALKSFGKFIFQFIRRHMPVKVKAVNMDLNGYYTVLLYGNGGECLNHLLIDNGWVTSVPYTLYHPFTDGQLVPAEFYDPEAKEILDFQYSCSPMIHYQENDGDEDYGYDNSLDQSHVHGINGNGYHQPHRNDGHVSERYKSNPYRKYRHKNQSDYETEGYRRHRNYQEKKRTNGYRSEPQAYENYTKGLCREEVEKSKGQFSKKLNQKPTKPTAEESPKIHEVVNQGPPNPAATTSTTTTTVKTSSSSKTKPENTTVTQVKPETVCSSTATVKSSPVEPKKTETKSSPETRTQVATAETTCAAVTNSKSPSPPPSNPWSSSRLSKSNIYKPKICTEKTQPSQSSSTNGSVSTSAVSFNSSSTVSTSSSKSSDKLSSSSTLVASNGSADSEVDSWTVVTSKRRSKRKGKY